MLNLLGKSWIKRVSTSPLAIKNSSFGFKKSFSTTKTNFNSTFWNKPVNHLARVYKSNGFKSMPLILGSTLSMITLHHMSHLPIANNTATIANPISLDYERKKSRFGGQLNYEELTIGSITGLFLGIIAGKLSSVIVILTLATYFLLQFLQSRNLITIPWNSIITLGKQKIDIKNLVFEKPSFKLSFVLTFLIAAFNV